MNNEELKQFVTNIVPKAEFAEGGQYLTVTLPKENIKKLAKALFETAETAFDYLFNLTGVDYGDKMCVFYHLESTRFHHCIVLKAFIPDREEPSIDTVSDIWQTANFHEREAYDFFGITFKNHPDLRRIFLDEIAPDIGHPFRKDYVDEINIIER
jgi:NADH:ubiquinone oxidoreductase subunit C